MKSAWLDILTKVNGRISEPLSKERFIARLHRDFYIEKEVNSIVFHDSYKLIQTGLGQSKIFK